LTDPRPIQIQFHQVSTYLQYIKGFNWVILEQPTPLVTPATTSTNHSNSTAAETPLATHQHPRSPQLSPGCVINCCFTWQLDHTRPGQLGTLTQFEPALVFVPLPNTTLARCARRIVSSRCAGLACSSTTRRATIVTLSMIVLPFPRARCLTLALAPDGAGPGRHRWSTKVILGGPLATRARALTSHHVLMFSCNPTVTGNRTIFARASQASRNNSSLRSSVEMGASRRDTKATPWPHRADTCAAFA